MENNYLELKGLLKIFPGDTIAVNRINLNIPKGKFISLLGPSGCGKTTTMRMIAGLDFPTEGEIWINGKMVSGAGVNVLPEKRKIGMVFQSYAVWPHMNVFDNIAYGLRMQKKNASEIKTRVNQMLDLVGLSNLENRYPMQLSGGQQQRVAIARALVVEPSLLLLDEPLSNLDEKLREEMRFELKSLQQRTGVTTLYVTHSQQEALVMSDYIGIMKDGVIHQFDQPEKIYNEPKTKFVASFIGLANFLPGTLSQEKSGEVTISSNNPIEGRMIDPIKNGDKVTVMVRPENLSLIPTYKDEFKGKQNCLLGKVVRVTFTGNIIDYFIQLEGVEDLVRVQTIPPKNCSEGEEVFLYFDSQSTMIYKGN